jgi:cell division control protein 6
MPYETLFRNEEVFDFSYIPEQFNYRDSQLKALAYCLKPAMRSAKPLNALLIGKPATGKTTAIKITFDQLEQETDRAVLVYVNCQIHSSPFRIFSEIHKKIVGYLPPETGVPLSSIYDKIFAKLSKEKQVLVVALDDINYLQNNEGVLYDLLRAYESYPGVKVGVLSVMQRNELHKLSDKTRSVFQPQLIEFLPYKTNEIFSILRNRADIGLYKNVVSGKIIERISELTSEKGDLRFGIELLKQSVMQAEAGMSKTVKENHVKKAAASISPDARQLEGNEKMILELIEKEAKSGELYELIKKKLNISYSSFYRLLRAMENKGLIKTEDITADKGGKTRIIRKA